MRFENQTILIISPQPWDHMHVSKHHYALELAARGNRVFFLEPPDASAASGVQLRTASEHPAITIVRYRPMFPFVVRFHARPVFDKLMLAQIRAIRAAIASRIDVVWAFEFNLFSNLKAFEPRLALFHPVDPLSERYQVDVARSADAVLSVSQDILSNFRHLRVPAWFINHGLSRPFEQAARLPLALNPRRDHLRVGYAGNLLRRPLNRRVLREMVESNPEVEFHFWGTRDSLQPVGQDIRAFIGFLQTCSNVRLHGAVAPETLAAALQALDCMVLAYSLDPRESDRSNSHKILEYLSTGKVVVSSRIATYAAEPELLRMSNRDDDSDLPALLGDTLSRVEEFNSPHLQERRRQFALDNTYSAQVDRIEAKLGA